MIDVVVSDRASASWVDAERLRRAAAGVLQAEGIASAEISIAVVDDRTIHDLNRRYLDHDDATDVLSFLLHRDGRRLEGEVIASAETAASSAPQYGWAPSDELLLYVIHGALHLAGYDDGTPGERAAMRREERRHLSHYRLTPRYDREDPPDAVAGAPPDVTEASEGDGSE